MTPPTFVLIDRGDEKFESPENFYTFAPRPASHFRQQWNYTL